MLETLRDFTQTLRDSPMGRKLVEANQRATHDALQLTADRLVALQRERTIAVETQRALLEPLEKSHQAATAKAADAELKMRRAQMAGARELGQLDADIKALQRVLRAPVEGRIREAQSAMWTRWELARETVGRGEMVTTPYRDDITRKVIERSKSNRGAIQRLLIAMRSTAVPFDRIALQNPRDLEAAIAEVLAPVEQAWQAIGDMAFDDGKAA